MMRHRITSLLRVAPFTRDSLLPQTSSRLLIKFAFEEPPQNYFYTTKHAANTATMPLVVPGVNNASASGNPKDEEWTKKLVGKKLHDSDSNETTFCKRDLPESTRIIEPGSMVTKDFRMDRLNVHLQDDGTVSHVAHG